jgi:hypothetical protein
MWDTAFLWCTHDFKCKKGFFSEHKLLAANAANIIVKKLN